MTTFELLVWSECPSAEEAHTRLAALLTDLGRTDIGIDVRWIETEEDAASVHFVGSPTYWWQGRELLAPGESAPIGLSCRVYRRRDGRPAPLPDPDDLRDAVVRALSAES